MNITIELDGEDWFEFHKYVSKRLITAFKKATDGFWFNVILITALTIIFLFIFGTVSDFHLPTAVITIVIFVLVFVILHFKSQKYVRAYEPKPGGAFIGIHNFEFDESGIRSYGNKFDAKHSWDLVQEIVREAGMIMIFIDTAMAFIFPEKKLQDPDEFYRQVTAYYENHKDQSLADSR
jgi:MFS superfamily sulfate permease-like transporter